MTFRTTFRETLSSRQIALIDLPCTKNARRIFAIVSTISIPTSASIIMEASVDPQPRGPDCMPITPKTGVLIPRRNTIDIHNADHQFLKAIAKVLNKQINIAERDVFRKHLLLGGPNDRTSG